MSLSLSCLLLRISVLHQPNPTHNSFFCRLSTYLSLSLTQDMMRSITEKHEEPYVRNRDKPYFDGIRKGDAPFIARVPILDFQESSVSILNSAPSSSKSNDPEPKQDVFGDVSENVSEKSSKNSSSDILFSETYGRSMSGRHSKYVTTPSFSFPDISSDSDIGLNSANDLVKEYMSRVSQGIPGLPKRTVERTYSMTKRKADFSGIPLPHSAASFYNGNSPQIEVVETCESITRLNRYLKAVRDEIRVGVPGRFLHAVIGQEATDVGSVASTIMYAFYLNETIDGSQLCTVPVVNMKREDLNSHAELKWLLESCHIDESSLIFIDEINLSYYYTFGSLKIVLINSHKIPSQQEELKEAVIEIFNCKKDDFVYPWVETVITGQDCSCCTLVAEKFSLTSPQILAGQGFSRLLLAAILLDTGNLKNPQCTSKDKYIATLLINGAGRFGCNGLYQILRYKMHDVSELKVGDILRKDFKKWTRVGKPDNLGSRLVVSHIGMSSIGTSVGQLLTHGSSAPQDIVLFQQSEKLRLLMIVSGYYDSQKNFKREILVSAESVELMRNLLHFLNSTASQLPLKVLHQPGLRDELRAFEIDNKITSRKTIERLLEDFGGTSRQ